MAIQIRGRAIYVDIYVGDISVNNKGTRPLRGRN